MTSSAERGPTDCPECGHRHTSAVLAGICVGCPCEWRPQTPDKLSAPAPVAGVDDPFRCGHGEPSCERCTDSWSQRERVLRSETETLRAEAKALKLSAPAPVAPWDMPTDWKEPCPTDTATKPWEYKPGPVDRTECNAQREAMVRTITAGVQAMDALRSETETLRAERDQALEAVDHLNADLPKYTKEMERLYEERRKAEARIRSFVRWVKSRNPGALSRSEIFDALSPPAASEPGGGKPGHCATCSHRESKHEYGLGPCLEPKCGCGVYATPAAQGSES